MFNFFFNPTGMSMDGCAARRLRISGRTKPRTPKGMTLVELLVALTLALAMAGLAYDLFTNTQSATRSGIDRSTIMQEAYVAEARLRSDFASMVGPSSLADSAAGAILIIPAMRTGTLPVPGKQGEQMLTQLRSDQLVIFYDAQHGGLIRDAGGGMPLKSLTRTGVKSAQAKIWLGHVRRASGESTSALDWVVGRQATLLVDDPSLPAPTGLELAPGLPASDPRSGLSPLNTVSQMSDVVPYGETRIANWMRAAGRTDADMVNAFAVLPNSTSNYTNQPTVVTQPLSDGVFDASDLFSSHRIFMSHRSEFIVQYSADLDCNGLIDTTGATPYALNQSTFTGTIAWYPKDADVFDGVASALKPVVFYPNDDQARVVHLGYYQGAADPATGKDAGGVARYFKNNHGDWTPYPAVGAAPNNNFGDALGGAAYTAAMAAYGAHHNNSSPTQWVPGGPLHAIPPAQSKWPQLIRIRYRLHDPRGQVVSFNEEFPFNHRNDTGDPARPASGAAADSPDESRCSGVWFEHIFSIPYPRVN